jgi:hypothetical protein
MSDDIHSPTTAGPTPEPTPTVGAAGATPAHPAGTAVATAAAATSSGTGAGEGEGELPFGIPPDRPEILVGAAFAGGVLAAIILKRLGSD